MLTDEDGDAAHEFWEEDVTGAEILKRIEVKPPPPPAPPAPPKPVQASSSSNNSSSNKRASQHAAKRAAAKAAAATTEQEVAGTKIPSRSKGAVVEDGAGASVASEKVTTANGIGEDDAAAVAAAAERMAQLDPDDDSPMFSDMPAPVVRDEPVPVLQEEPASSGWRICKRIKLCGRRNTGLSTAPSGAPTAVQCEPPVAMAEPAIALAEEPPTESPPMEAQSDLTAAEISENEELEQLHIAAAQAAKDEKEARSRHVDTSATSAAGTSVGGARKTNGSKGSRRR